MSKEEVEAKEQIFSFVKENEEEVKIVERDRFRVIKKASMQIRGSRIPGFFKSDMLFCKVKFPNFQLYQFFYLFLSFLIMKVNISFSIFVSIEKSLVFLTEIFQKVVFVMKSMCFCFISQLGFSAIVWKQNYRIKIFKRYILQNMEILKYLCENNIDW